VGGVGVNVSAVGAKPDWMAAEALEMVAKRQMMKSCNLTLTSLDALSTP